MWRQNFLHLTRALGILVSILMCVNLYGHSSKPLRIIFNQSSSKIDSTLADNARKLAELDSLFAIIRSDTLVSLGRVNVECTSSPDGDMEYNQRLSQGRAAVIVDYLEDVMQVPDSLIFLDSYTVLWSQMRSSIANREIDHKQQIMDILDSYPSDSVAFRLKQIDNGKTYSYIASSVLPELRCANIFVVYHNKLFTPIDQPTYYLYDLLEPRYILGYGCLQECPTASKVELKPLLAVKTNLLFDVLTLINIEVEVPIKDRWSIAGEFIFPWWSWDNKQLDSRRHRIQLLNGTLEARYWLGSRADKEILSGWFIGLYGGGGVYDFEYDKKGYQGEFMVAAGISSGYAHTINKSKSLRMEYSLGVGLLRTKYRYYEVDCYYDNRWHPMKEREGIYTWIGPTRAKVSLSWLINYSKKY